MTLFIEKMFSSFWWFWACFLVLALLISMIEVIVKKFFEMLPKLIHGQSDNFYINTDDFYLDDKMKIKKAADKIKS